jgi:DNA-binding LytR/AlgR family response regulator
MKAFIIDDESPARRELRYLLDQTGSVEIVGEAATGLAGLQGIRETGPDIAFLDIQMPGLDGLQVSRVLSELPHRPLLIFATAFQKYAVEAFEVEAFDYILKPFSDERVRKSVDKAMQFLSRTPLMAADHLRGREEQPAVPAAAKRIPLFKGEKIIPTPPEKILFVRCQNDDLIVHTRDGRYKAKSSLHELEQKLSPFGFIRTHRSYLVNSNAVVEMIPWFNGSVKLIMDDKERTEVLVSRYNVKDLKRYYDL